MYISPMGAPSNYRLGRRQTSKIRPASIKGNVRSSTSPGVFGNSDKRTVKPKPTKTFGTTSVMKKKNSFSILLLIILVLYTCFSYGQTVGRSEQKDDSYTKVITRAGSFSYAGSKPLAKGSLYLYDSWNGVAVVETTDGEKLLIKKVNYNIDAQHFEAMFAPDSTYHFNLDYVETITLNNKKYKQFEFKGEQKIFEIIYEESEEDDFAILKSYNISVVYASNDPMVNRPNDVYSKRRTYYVKEGNKIDVIHLNKKNILKIFESRDISKDKVEKHVKENDLSYKDEFDVDMLFHHFFNE